MANKCINDFNHTVRTYYKELGKYKPLDRDTERRLIKRAKDNNVEAKNYLITSNLKFVFNIAKRYKGRGVSIDDLISEGNLGLVKAIDKFDTSKNVRFLTYAIWWIKHSMSEFINKRNVVEDHEILTDGCEKDISDSLYDECDDGEETDRIELEDVNDEERYGDAQAEILNKIMLKLDDRSKYIIKSYFGFGKKSMSLEDIGKEIGLSRERVRKIKEKGLRVMRSELLLNSGFSEYFDIY